MAVAAGSAAGRAATEIAIAGRTTSTAVGTVALHSNLEGGIRFGTQQPGRNILEIQNQI